MSSGSRPSSSLTSIRVSSSPPILARSRHGANRRPSFSAPTAQLRAATVVASRAVAVFEWRSMKILLVKLLAEGESREPPGAEPLERTLADLGCDVQVARFDEVPPAAGAGPAPRAIILEA